MGACELADAHRILSCQFFDVIIHPSHHTVLVGFHGAPEVLDDIRWNPHRVQRLTILFDRDDLEVDPAALRLAEFRRHLIVVHLDRTKKRVSLTGMSSRVLQDCRDHATLVLRPNGGMLPLADGQADDPLLDEQGELPRIEQPLEEIRRAEMGDCEARPIEDLLGDKGVFAGIAFRMAISRSLRQIDDRGDACESSIFCLCPEAVHPDLPSE
jgi:hypothetical protein